MSTNILLNIKTRKQFRSWLKKNSTKKNECFLVLKRGKPVDKKVFYYIDAVEEALCFGWIDSTLTIVDGIRLQRFSPRRSNSNWTELNKERCRRLIKLKLMTNEGLKVLPNLDEKFQMSQEFIKVLKKNKIYDKFIKFPLLYQRIRAASLADKSKIKDPKVYKKMLNNFILHTKENKMYGLWNDYGRLVKY